MEDRMAQSQMTYRVRKVDPTGAWSWEVVSEGKLIAAGMAPTETEARATAMLEAMTRLGKRSGDGVGEVGS
jgi:hypothetical protein